MNNNGELNNVNTTAATVATAEPKLTPLPADQETNTAQMEVIQAINEEQQKPAAEPQIISQPVVVAQEEVPQPQIVSETSQPEPQIIAATPQEEVTPTVEPQIVSETPQESAQPQPAQQPTQEAEDQIKYENDIKSMTVTLDTLNGKTEPVEVPTEPVVEVQTQPVQQPETIPQNLSKKELKKLQKEQAKQAKMLKKQGVASEPVPPATNPDGTPVTVQEVPQQGGSFFKILVVLAVIVLAGYIVYTNRSYQAQINNLKFACTPVTTNTKEEQLPLDSTLVQSLYAKVKTTIKEDYAHTEWDNKMKLYLAYRQIPVNEKYPSNCNMFNATQMEPFICEVSPTFVPQAFKVETLELEFKKLFGEETPFQLDDVKLDRGCVGGYQYIPERQEFVQGTCPQQSVTPIKVDKKLKEARSYRNTIILVEDVKYTGSDKTEIPSYLKNGTYFYTFRLDMNYNFVFVSKTYEDLY